MFNNNAPLTVANLSRHYDLPLSFLGWLGLTDGPEGVHTPFLDASGKQQAALLRTSLTESFAGGWPRGKTPAPWGQWCLPTAQQRGQLYLTFNEPDAWVLWRHALPALALPEPSCLELEHVPGNISIVIHRSPNEMGGRQVERVRVKLMQLNYAGRVCELRLLNGHASLADLHRAAPQDFRTRLMESLHDARPLKVRPVSPNAPPRPLQDYENRWPARLYLQSESVCGPLHPGSAALGAEPVVTTPAPAWDERAWLQSQAPAKLLEYLGHERGEAMRFLQAELSTGPKSAQALLRAARGRGLSARTLRRAKKTLAVKSQRRRVGTGAGEWVWVLAVKE